MQKEEIAKFPADWAIADFLEKAAWFAHHDLLEENTLGDIGQNITIGLLNIFDDSDPQPEEIVEESDDFNASTQSYGEVSNARVSVTGPAAFVQHVVQAANDYAKAQETK